MSAGPGEWLHWIGTAAHGGHIRWFVLQAHHLDELVALGTRTAQVVRFPEAAVASGLNLLVSSGTQADKTTLATFPPQLGPDLCIRYPQPQRLTCGDDAGGRVVVASSVAGSAFPARRASRRS